MKKVSRSETTQLKTALDAFQHVAFRIDELPTRIDAIIKQIVGGDQNCSNYLQAKNIRHTATMQYHSLQANRMDSNAIKILQRITDCPLAITTRSSL